jgi:hypothetical protein
MFHVDNKFINFHLDFVLVSPMVQASMNGSHPRVKYCNTGDGAFKSCLFAKQVGTSLFVNLARL